MNNDRQPIYPIEPWTVSETDFQIGNNYRNETTFALSNGYIGTRGTFEEGYDFSVEEGLEGNFINGFYESEAIRYGEWNFGFPETSQSLLNLPNMKTTRIFLEDEVFDLRQGTVADYRRILHLREGTVTRKLQWTSPGGKKIKIETVRLVSFTRKNVMAQRMTVTPLNFRGKVRLESCLCAEVENHTRKMNPLVDYGPFGRHLEKISLEFVDDEMIYTGKTANSGLTMACGSKHKLIRLSGKGVKSSIDRVSQNREELSASLTFNADCEPGEKLILDKWMVYTSCLDGETEADNRQEEKSRSLQSPGSDSAAGLTDFTNPDSAAAELTDFTNPDSAAAGLTDFTNPDSAAGGLADFVRDELEKAAAIGFDTLLQEQSEYTRRFWETADVWIDGDDAVQQGIRFNLFHIMQAAGRDGHTGMGAKGLSGEGYEGHYFWDTEIYILPVFIHTFPELARELLNYRYQTLDEARKRARILGHPKGALYPWRTINGSEASTYVPLGTAQYHINADVAYAFWQYIRVSGDGEYLKTQAAEVLCETARVWADVGCFSEAREGQYCICCVTGPDEYTAFVDNNFYTNLMARENLRAALEAVIWLQNEDRAAYGRLAGRIGLEDAELALWQEIVDKMYLPYDEKAAIFLQDDGMLLRKEWDDSRIPPEKRHLLYENYHPLYLWRQRMAKQADSLLGMYLHRHLFTADEMKRNYDYYQRLTLHHSSLSTCIFGIVAGGIGYREDACRYFNESARMDLDDYHQNFYAGIHAANMAGTWQAVVNGFAGLCTGGGQLTLAPFLPAGWRGYGFRMWYRGSRLAVSVRENGCEVILLNDVPVTFLLNGITCELRKAGDRGANDA